MLTPGLANHNQWAKSNWLPMSVNKVLLEHSNTCSFTHCTPVRVSGRGE